MKTLPNASHKKQEKVSDNGIDIFLARDHYGGMARKLRLEYLEKLRAPMRATRGSLSHGVDPMI